MAQANDGGGTEGDSAANTADVDRRPLERLADEDLMGVEGEAGIGSSPCASIG